MAKNVPGEDVFAAFAAELKAASKAKSLALVGKRLNYEIPTLKSKVTVTARKLDKLEVGPWKEALLVFDPVWNDPGRHGRWSSARGCAFTPYYLLSVLDLRQDDDGSIEGMPGGPSDIYPGSWPHPWHQPACYLDDARSRLSCCHMLATLPQRTASILMIFVLLPFWTSLLVRTTAWTILLQDGGVITQFFNFTGVTWGAQYTWVPRWVSQNSNETRFARSGHDPHSAAFHAVADLQRDENDFADLYAGCEISRGHAFHAFRTVYMPQTLPGVAAGCLLTFILSLGYFITPAFVGGPTDNMIAGFIDGAMNSEGNWGKASALGSCSSLPRSFSTTFTIALLASTK